MSIQRLPDDVVGKITSSTVITSLNGAVSGLLKNSLDSGATKVNITIDYTRGNCIIEDNGHGIPPSEFKESGGLGRTHHTSRFPPSAAIFGSRGNFIASLAALSLLMISSRHVDHVSHNALLLHNGQVLSRNLPASPEQRLSSFERGTRIAVRDLFGSMPVRVKQRAMIASERSSTEKEWSRLVSDVVGILLSCPGNVSLSLRETSSQHELRLKPPEESTPTSRVSRLFTQASLADSVHKDSWVSLSASSKHASIKGCVSLIPVATKRAQFISLGIHPVTNESGTNVLYEEVNSIFSNSAFGSLNELHARRRGEHDSDSHENMVSKFRKGIERWPMFYFQVHLRDSMALSDVDHILDNRRNELSRISDLLKAMCYGFLKKHHHQPKKVHMSTQESAFSTSKSLGRAKSRRESRPSSAKSSHPSAYAPKSYASTGYSDLFHGWPRVKIGHATRPSFAQQKLSERTASPGSTCSKERLVGSDGRLLRAPFDDEDKPIETELRGSQHFHNEESTESLEPINNSTESTESSSSEATARRYSLAQRPKNPPSEWLQGVLRSWDNPVFENVAAPIPKAYDETPEAMDSGSFGTRSRHFATGQKDCSVNFEAGSLNLQGRISKDALFSAEVLSQVDKKFILVRLCLDHATQQSDETTALVMLDQHAVDERCKLEDLMEAYFALRHSDGVAIAETEVLSKPLRFEVGNHEGRILTKAQAYFKSWGIVYQVEKGELVEGIRTPTIKVTSLPPSILERCATERRLLIDLLRKEAWQLEEGHRSSRIPTAPADAEHPWVSLFSQCPRGILELLHSRSCRSAVMFNDVLTQAECEAMVRKVARCAFPFQCAHGRPSMVPLVDMGSKESGSRIGGWLSDAEIVDWKRWMN